MPRTSSFLRLEESDIREIQRTVPVVAPHLDSLVEDVYDQMTSFGEFAVLFQQAHVSTGESIDVRVATLKSWLLRVLEMIESNPAELARFLATTGASHAGVGPGKVYVPMRLMVLTIAYLEVGLLRALADAGAAAAVAWHKLLWVALDGMASAYGADPAWDRSAPEATG